MSTLHLDESQQIEFSLPFSADADRIVDSNGREVCEVSSLCGPEEAIRIARLLASSWEAITLLNGIKSFIYASTKDLPEFKHGADDEDKSACLLCAIDEFNERVFGEAAPKSRIITE